MWSVFGGGKRYEYLDFAKKLINSGSAQKKVKIENVKNSEKSDHKFHPFLWLPQKQALPPVAASGLTAPSFTMLLLKKRLINKHYYLLTTNQPNHKPNPIPLVMRKSSISVCANN